MNRNRFTLHVRQACETDLSGISAVQKEAYPLHFLESDEVMAARLAACPETCWVMEDGQGVCAYLLAYRSVLAQISAFGDEFKAIAQGDSLYLHDLAVSRRAKGAGAARALVQTGLEQAKQHGLRYSGLVSVQESSAFWQGFGFQEHLLEDPAQREKLFTYHGAAIYMMKSLVAV